MKIKFIQLFLIASCFFYLSCQPSGGDFIPVLSDGVILKPMFGKEKSALQYNDAKFSIKVASGGWGSLDHSKFWLILKNNSANKVVLSLDKILLKSSFDQQSYIYSVGQLFPIVKPEVTWQKFEIVIAKGEMRAYVLHISDGNQKEMYEREKYLGQTISLTIPVKTDLEDKSYEFQFKYGDYLPQGEYNETLID